MTRPDADRAGEEAILRRSLALRHIARDDLLHLAAEATEALSILGPGDDRFGTNDEIYAAAIEAHLESAARTRFWSVKVNCLSRAAVLLRFCEHVDALDPDLGLGRDGALATLVDDRTPSELLTEARGILDGYDDRYREVKLKPLIARELRLSNRLRDARAAADPGDWDTFFTRSGAELHKANVALELVFACIASDDPKAMVEAERRLRSLEEYWRGDLPATWGTRGRHHQAYAVLRLATNLGEGELQAACEGLAAAEEAFASYTEQWRVERSIETLSVLITLAELCSHLASRRHGAESATLRARAVAVCRRALHHVELLRAEWTVVTRTRSPLSFVLRLALGELAEVVSTLGTDREAALTGLQLSLTAKHSGIAELIRAQRAAFGAAAQRPGAATRHPFRDLVDQLVTAETNRAIAGNEARRLRAGKIVNLLRQELRGHLAALVFPVDIGRDEVERICASAGGRVLVDFVQLPTLSVAAGSSRVGARDAWFGTTVFGPDRADFRLVSPGPGYEALFTKSYYDDEDGREGSAMDLFDLHEVATNPAWAQLAGELLHPDLCYLLSESGSDLELLLSPHGVLCRLPWGALIVAGDDTRLIERARPALVPLFTSFTGITDAVPGTPALAAIVNTTAPDDALHDQAPVREAWGLPGEGDRTEIALCAAPGWAPALTDRSLAEVLASRESQFTFFTAHGSGTGFAQLLDFPEEPLTAAAALAYDWPPCVVLNACHSGAVDATDDAEPMGFVVAAMAGGARVVVGGVQVVYSPFSAQVWAELARRVRSNTDGVPLHTLLHRVQRERARDDIRHWASLTIFVS